MKKAGIMQPYFFPYLGYFSLIKHTDEYILLDAVQFMRHGWIERNKILKQTGEWLYIKVPLLKHPQEALIKDIMIDNDQDWQAKIMAQLQAYKKVAPFYGQVSELIQGVINQKFLDVVSLNKAGLEAVCSYLGITTNIQIFSQMDLDIETPQTADDWALNICKALGVHEYWNPPGGKAIFDRDKYSQAGITIKFQSINLGEYDQKRQPFEPGLSIIDVMMFNSVEKINELLDSYELT